MQAEASPKSSSRGSLLTVLIMIALAIGVIAGWLINSQGLYTPGVGEGLGIITTIFLRLIKMIIAPLVFATLVVGIAKMGDMNTVGRVGLKAVLWFLSASFVSLLLGLLLVNLFKPGVGMSLADAQSGASSGVVAGNLTLVEFVNHLVPISLMDAMARNEILQIVVFSVFFGIACAGLGEKAKALVDVLDGVGHAMLKVTMMVMWFAPLAVLAAVTRVVGERGLGIIEKYFVFMTEFYLGIALLWLILFLAAGAILGRRVVALFKAVREPTLLAFATASSEAAYPKTLAQLEKFGCSNRVASFVLPLGYSFNLDGSMMYCTFATVFIAQAYGIDLSWSQQATMLLILMVTSKGMAGVPRASLVVIAATLAQFNIPEAGLLLLLGVDHFLDMGRSATNVIGNSVATAVVSKWEGQLRDEQPAA